MTEMKIHSREVGSSVVDGGGIFEVVPGNPNESYNHVVIRYDNEITWWSSINLSQQSPDGTTIELTVIFLFLTCWQFLFFSS